MPDEKKSNVRIQKKVTLPLLSMWSLEWAKVNILSRNNYIIKFEYSANLQFAFQEISF